MLEHRIQMTPIHLLAVFLWSAAIIVWSISWATHTVYLTSLAVMLSCAAGTTSVRGFFINHEENMKTALKVTGRDGSVYSINR